MIHRNEKTSLSPTEHTSLSQNTKKSLKFETIYTTENKNTEN